MSRLDEEKKQKRKNLFLGGGEEGRCVRTTLGPTLVTGQGQPSQKKDTWCVTLIQLPLYARQKQVLKGHDILILFQPNGSAHFKTNKHRYIFQQSSLGLVPWLLLMAKCFLNVSHKQPFGYLPTRHVCPDPAIRQANGLDAPQRPMDVAPSTKFRGRLNRFAPRGDVGERLFQGKERVILGKIRVLHGL